MLTSNTKIHPAFRRLFLSAAITCASCLAGQIPDHLNPLAFFDAGARAFYQDNLELAKEAVFHGLNRFPDDPELLKLKELLEQAEKQQQQDQQPEEQDQGDPSQEQEGDSNPEGQAEDGDDSEDPSQQQSNDSESTSDNQEESGTPNPDNQSERSAEDYADQKLDDPSENELPSEADDSPEAAVAPQSLEIDPERLQEFLMATEDAERLLDALRESERQLPFIIPRRDTQSSDLDY